MTEPLDSVVEERFRAWLRERNRTGTRAMLWMGLFLYPAFGVLDWLRAPDQLHILWTTRVILVAVTAWMLWFRHRPAYARRPDFWSAAYLAFGGLGISLMTVYMGGLASPYYAGLSLLVCAGGLLFVWPASVVVPTNAAIVAGWGLLNLALAPDPSLLAGVSNLFFLAATALIISVGQVLNYAAAREQVAARVTTERTQARLQEAHERLQALDRFKSESVANLTHELKTPLSLVLAPLELALEGARGEAAVLPRATLRGMLRSGQRLLRLIDDLLDLSRVEDDQLRLRVVPVELVGWVRELVHQAEPLAGRRSLTLRFESGLSTAEVWVDPDQLERVLVNLLSNAVKFTPEGGSVMVRVEGDPAEVRLELEDTGVGFPPELAERLFDRFYQADMGPSRKHGGTGIGLALSRGLVELHGGRIAASPRPGGGARFVVRLRRGNEHYPREWLASSTEEPRPRDLDAALDPIADLAPADPGAPDQEPPPARERRHTVLVVDDTAAVRNLVSLTLAGTCETLTARNGEEALCLARERRPSLVITDWMMPGLDGLGLTRELRADPRTRHIPVVMLTARDSVGARVATLDSGVDRYLAKPFSPAELRATVEAVLRSQESTAVALLERQMDSLEVVAGGLAHQLNNPLNYLRQGLAVVQRDTRRLVALASGGQDARAAELAERVERTLEAMAGGVSRIGATVELMRRYARDGYSRSPQAFDLGTALSDVIGLVVSNAGVPLKVRTRFEGDLAVLCVPDEVNQLFTNLVQNAVDALGEVGGGELAVEAERRDGEVRVRVSDTGPGIRPEDRARVFAPFYTTKEPGKGMGMGLTIAQRVVNSLGGTIRLEGGPGVGTVFVVQIPAAPRGATGPPA